MDRKCYLVVAVLQYFLLTVGAHSCGSIQWMGRKYDVKNAKKKLLTSSLESWLNRMGYCFFFIHISFFTQQPSENVCELSPYPRGLSVSFEVSSCCDTFALSVMMYIFDARSV